MRGFLPTDLMITTMHRHKISGQQITDIPPALSIKVLQDQPQHHFQVNLEK